MKLTLLAGILVIAALPMDNDESVTQYDSRFYYSESHKNRH